MLNFTDDFNPGRRSDDTPRRRTTDPKQRFCKCGTDISEYKASKTKCYACRHTEAPQKKCMTCGVEFQGLHQRRCDNCVAANYVWRVYVSGQIEAGSAVACARAKGILPPPTNFPCDDCGKPATEYDHRDYNKPLDVAPVCRSCNNKRGHAVMLDRPFDEFWKSFIALRDESRSGPLKRGVQAVVEYEHFYPLRRLRGEVIPTDQ